MAESLPSNGQTELSRIDSLVSRTRRLLRSAWLATGSSLTVGLCLATLGATALLDLLLPLPVPLRLVAWIGVVVPTLLALVAGVVRPATRRLSANQVARRIERQIPQIQSRLVTALDLATHGDQPRYSPAFFEKFLAETVARVETFQPSSVIDRESLRRSALFAGVALLAFGLAFLIFGGRLPVALARILSPFADIPPASGVLYRAEPGNAKILKGEDQTIAAVVERGNLTELELEFRTPGAKWTKLAMDRTGDDRFEFTIQQVTSPIEYRLVGGRTWTRKHRIDVAERPTITDLHTVVRYPEYMKLREPKISPPQTGDAAGPIGSDVEIVVAVAGDVATGEIQIVNPVTRMRALKDRHERVWFEGTLPEGARAEGNWQWDHALKFRPAHTEPAAAGPHSHGFSGTPVGFEVRPGENLFTYVFIVPGQVPEEIMVQWHDGTSWEHRAFWGADKIQAGTANTPARLRVGDIPAVGDWVQLEVPAKAVGLEGKKIHGVSFMLFGGQCKWNRAGTIDPAEIPERGFVVAETYPMKPRDASDDASPTDSIPAVTPSPSHPLTPSSVWSGHVPLSRDAQYRVVLKNDLGAANKEMRESKITAIPDNPPQVIVERPGMDLVLSAPQKVPLVVRAYDDFGLADVSLAVQKGDSGGFVGAPLRTYDDPVRNDSLIAALDLAPHQLKVGEHLRYRVQARDRKGQIAQTQEFVVRIAADNNAADKQLAAIEQQQDAFQKKLTELIANQAKVTEAVERMAGKERPADSNQIVDGKETRQPGDIRPAPTAAAKNDTAKNAPNPPANPNDPAAVAALQQKLNELRQELAKLAGQEDANAQLGGQLDAQLNQIATQAAASKLMPDQIAAQMRAVEQAFQNMAVQPMRELAQAMRQGADPKQGNPDVNALAEKSEQIQRELEALKPRLDALAKAQQNLKNDPAAALAQLRDDLVQANAELASREVAELKDFLDRLLGQMKMLEGKENLLAQQTKDALPSLLPQVDKEQMNIEEDAAKLLAQAERLMEAEKLADLKHRRRTPQFPDAPFTPDGEEMLVPPHEEDTPEPASAEMKGANDAAKKADSNNMDDEDEDLFMPPTGARQKVDPRFAKKARPVPKKNDPGAQAQAKQMAPQPNDLRSQLAQRQQQTAQQLNDAQHQLQPRRDQLAQLMQQLQQALGLESPEAARELAEMLHAMGMQQALQMAQAMRQPQTPHQQPGQPQQPQQASQAQIAQALMQSLSTQPNMGTRIGVLAEFEANDIDLAGQTIILRMQPRLREELLKGMREEGPEGYRKFIQDYFNRLTKVKSPQ